MLGADLRLVTHNPPLSAWHRKIDGQDMKPFARPKRSKMASAVLTGTVCQQTTPSKSRAKRCHRKNERFDQTSEKLMGDAGFEPAPR